MCQVSLNSTRIYNVEFFAGLLTGVFAFPVLVWTSLAWWALILLLAGIVTTETLLYSEKDGWAGFWLFIVAIFLGVQFAPETEGALPYLSAIVWTVMVGLFDYIIIGLVVSVPLWLIDYRKRYVTLRNELTTFLHACAKPDNEYPRTLRETFPKGMQLLSEEQRGTCREYRSGGPIPEFMHTWWSQYRTDELGFRKEDTKIINNLDTIASYAFLWPFHVITRVFGDILAKIPEWFGRTFGELVDLLAQTVRWGIPKGIDD